MEKLKSVLIRTLKWITSFMLALIVALACVWVYTGYIHEFGTPEPLLMLESFLGEVLGTVVVTAISFGVTWDLLRGWREK